MRKKTVERGGTIKGVRLGNTRVFDQAQRTLDRAKVDSMLASFEVNYLGVPVVSARDGAFYIVDGQHRIKALAEWLGPSWEDVHYDCLVYEGLTDVEEAEMFINLNNAKPVNSFDKFKVALTARNDDAVAINHVVTTLGLCISREEVPGAIQAVTKLTTIFRRGGSELLGRALKITRDAYGDAGLRAPVIDGIGHLCHRYNGVLNDAAAIAALKVAHGGVSGLLNKAEDLRRKTGNGKALCIAAAAVSIINAKGGSKKLPSWWKQEAAAA